MSALDRQRIAAQYVNALGRAAAPEELAYWEKVIASGNSIDAALNGIATSPEAQAFSTAAPSVNELATANTSFGAATVAPPGELTYQSGEPSMFQTTTRGEGASSTGASAAGQFWAQILPKLGFQGSVIDTTLRGSGEDLQASNDFTPEARAFIENLQSQGYDVGATNEGKGYTVALTGPDGNIVTDQAGTPVSFTGKEGTILSGMLGAAGELAPIALVALGANYLGPMLGPATAAVNPVGAGTAGAITAGGSGAAGAGAAGAGGAGFVGLENELAGLAAAEAGMGGAAGAALPGIETALAEGSAGVSAYEAAAATKAAADIASPAATTPGTTPVTTPGTTPVTTPGTTPSVSTGGVPWGEIIGSLAALYGGQQSAEAAQAAARIQAESINKATQLQRDIYEKGVELQKPFYEGGKEAFNRLTALSTGGPQAAQNFLTMDPGYGFRLGEGMKALERLQASRGGLLSGGAIKAGQRYAQDVASQEYGNAYNRLAQLADVGPRAAGVTTQLGQNYATSAGNLLGQSGTNSANALLTGAAARQSAYGDIGNIWGRYFGGGQ